MNTTQKLTAALSAALLTLALAGSTSAAIVSPMSPPPTTYVDPGNIAYVLGHFVCYDSHLSLTAAQYYAAHNDQQAFARNSRQHGVDIGSSVILDLTIDQTAAQMKMIVATERYQGAVVWCPIIPGNRVFDGWLALRHLH